MSYSFITTLARLKESGAYAWPGGYPIEYVLADAAVVLCYECATEALTEAVRQDITELIETGKRGTNARELQLVADIVSSDQMAYGGVACECGKWIAEPQCPECGDELNAGETQADGLRVPVLHCDSADAIYLCRKCAAAHIVSGQARRLPGLGIEMQALPEDARRSAYDDGLPWYARAGQRYEYAQPTARHRAERERAYAAAERARQTAECDRRVQSAMQAVWPGYAPAESAGPWPVQPSADDGAGDGAFDDASADYAGVPFWRVARS